MALFVSLACAASGEEDSGDDGITNTGVTSLTTSSSAGSEGEEGTMTSTTTSGESSDGCTPGTEGCGCLEGQCLGGELACIDGLCQTPPCTPDPSFYEDPENCGSCGVVCRTDRYLGARCIDGACPPATAECFDEPQTCDEACQSIGEQCVEAGCFFSIGTPGYTSVDFLVEGACKVPGGGSDIGSSNAPCSAVVPGFDWHTCCCTDSGTTP